MLTIGQLAREAQVPTSTVRYYEGRGLLRPESRTASRYRMYGPESLQRLRFIRAAQSSGFTLEDVTALLALRDGAADPCGEVQEIVASRLAAIEGELVRLRRVRKVLRETLEWCQEPRSSGCCAAVTRLDEQATGTRPPRKKGSRRARSSP